MSKLKPAFRFILLGTLAFLLIGRETEREIIPISSRELVAKKKDWERTQRAEAGPEVLQHLVDSIIYKEILCREALRLHFHQTDSVVWNRLVQNMRFATPDTHQDEGDLFQQALSLDMHLSDLIVKRRLVARMEQFIKHTHYIDEPDESDIDRLIIDKPDLFSKGERLSFCHVFLN